MLGKCIKNEFVNRSGLVGMISAGVMLFAVIVLGLDKLYNVVGTTAFAVFVKLVDVMFALAMFAVIVMVVLLPCLDFRNRFFKDQGYLTHTLPVKTSTLIGARLICDLVMIAWMVAVYGLAVCVATGNFEVFSDFVGFVQQFLSMSGMTVQRGLIVLDGVGTSYDVARCDVQYLDDQCRLCIWSCIYKGETHMVSCVFCSDPDDIRHTCCCVQ